MLAVPPDKRIQCAWYMALYDVDLTYLVALADTHIRRTFALHRDRDLEAMLLELMASDLERRPFVIVEDVVTKKFVQFIRRYKPKTGELLFDVPALSVVLNPCPSAKVGAMWATSTFTGAFSLPSWAEIQFWLTGEPAS